VHPRSKKNPGYAYGNGTEEEGNPRNIWKKGSGLSSKKRGQQTSVSTAGKDGSTWLHKTELDDESGLCSVHAPLEATRHKSVKSEHRFITFLRNDINFVVVKCNNRAQAHKNNNDFSKRKRPRRYSNKCSISSTCYRRCYFNAIRCMYFAVGY